MLLVMDSMRRNIGGQSFEITPRFPAMFASISSMNRTMFMQDSLGLESFLVGKLGATLRCTVVPPTAA